MLANNLKKLREENNLTQMEFAKLFDVDRSTVSKWERGIYVPSVITLAKVATFFNIPIEDLTGKVETNDSLNEVKEELHDFVILSKETKTHFMVPFI